MKKRSKLSTQRLRKPWQVACLAFPIAIILVSGAYVVYRENHKPTTIKIASPTPKMFPDAQPSPSTGPGKDTHAHSGPAKDTPTTAPTPASNPDHPVTGTLIVYGPNVSSRTVSRSSAVDSTCRSAIGARCHIEATNGSKTITVSETKTISGDGADGVNLPWNASKLSVGVWKVQAVAVANDGRKGVSASENIEVTP